MLARRESGNEPVVSMINAFDLGVPFFDEDPKEYESRIEARRCSEIWR